MIQRIVLACLGLAVTLTGCGVAEATSPTPSPESAYLTGLDRGAVPHPDDEQAVALGRSVCTQFDAGDAFVSVGFTVMSTGLTAEQSGWLMGTAIGTFCPEHVGVIDAAASI